MRRAGERQPEKKEGNLKLIIFVSLFLLIVLLFGARYVFHMPNFQVKGIDIEGQVLGSEEDLRRIVEENLSGTYYFLIPKTNRWFYPKNTIEETLSEHPQFEAVEVSLNEEKMSLLVSLKERDRKYLWCDASCYYLSESGFVFSSAPTFEGRAYPVLRGLLQGEPVGQTFSTRENLEAVVTIENFFTSVQEKVKETVFVSEKEIRMELTSGTFIHIDLSKKADDSVASLKTLLQSEGFQKATGGIRNLTYLDIRFGNKAFWKVKGES